MIGKHLTDLILVCAVAVLAACSSTKVPLTPAAPIESTAAPSAPKTEPPARSTVAPVVAVSPLDDPNSPLAKRSIFFDFDIYEIRSIDIPLVERHAAFMVANKNVKASLEGNADERGGSEYNLALGQKRAEAVRHALVLLGVPDASLEAVSFGKEKPLDPGHNEEAWAKNRRVDIRYIAQ